jgi:2-oxoglutarate dehydrogenase complex dehydrogenase (E1) component-like enzyme
LLKPSGRVVKYVGRPSSATSAVGFGKAHQKELENLLDQAMQ